RAAARADPDGRRVGRPLSDGAVGGRAADPAVSRAADDRDRRVGDGGARARPFGVAEPDDRAAGPPGRSTPADHGQSRLGGGSGDADRAGGSGAAGAAGRRGLRRGRADAGGGGGGAAGGATTDAGGGGGDDGRAARGAAGG